MTSFERGCTSFIDQGFLTKRSIPKEKMTIRKPAGAFRIYLSPYTPCIEDKSSYNQALSLQAEKNATTRHMNY